MPVRAILALSLFFMFTATGATGESYYTFGWNYGQSGLPHPISFGLPIEENPREMYVGLGCSYRFVVLCSSISLSVCIDLTTTCVTNIHLCANFRYDSMMNFYCKKTCNRDCTVYTTTTTKKRETYLLCLRKVRWLVLDADCQTLHFKIEFSACADITPDCLNKKALCTMSAFTALTNQVLLFSTPLHSGKATLFSSARRRAGDANEPYISLSFFSHSLQFR